jgi:hypothetical protein
MSDTRIVPPTDDLLAGATVLSLRFRYRAYLVVVALLAGCVVISLVGGGGAVTEWSLACTGWCLGIGVPWLGWHLRVPFAGRVAAVVFQLSGFALNGQDPRGELWLISNLTLFFFIAGWGIDICLRQRTRLRTIVGRVLFTLLWLFLIRQAVNSPEEGAYQWFYCLGMLVGIVVVWLPRGRLLPPAFRPQPAAEEAVRRGLRSAGGWIATRVGIAMLIVLPSLVYLDLLDLPPILRAELEAKAEAAKAEAEAETAGAANPDAATATPDDSPLLYWKREARGLTKDDFGKLEVHVAAPDSTKEVVTAIRNLYKDPLSEEAVKKFESLAVLPVKTAGELNLYLGRLPVFYIDRQGSGDERVTAGMFSVPEAKWSRWNELEPLTSRDSDRIETGVHRATLVILAGGVLILLLLGGPSGGSRAAWWLAIFLAGTNLGWVNEALELTLDRVRFVIWRYYAEESFGASLYGVHTLVVILVELAQWLTNNLVTHAGLWVTLCWPAKNGPLIRSWLDRFWVQLGKIAVLAMLLSAVRLGFFLVASWFPSDWSIGWFFVFPPVFVGLGVWWRSRWQAGMIRGGQKLPNAGRVVAIAFILRGWVPLLTNIEGAEIVTGTPGLWIGHAAVVLTLVATLLLIISLERGTFLSPPHVEGQLWLIGVAAIPFIENVLGDPVNTVIEDSRLFLGNTVGWLAFAAGLWGIGPLFSRLGDFLSQWRAKGLDRIGEFEQTLLTTTRIDREAAIPPETLCDELFADLEITEPQFWQHLGEGYFRTVSPGPAEESHKLISASLAEALGGAEASLRLEEMRFEWRWAAYHDELDHWFNVGGDLLLVPAAREGELLGVFCAPDLPENRFLLRPAVAGALGHALGSAVLRIAPTRRSAREKEA